METIMCQAYAGEQAYLFNRERRAREEGYNAHKNGATCSDNPYTSNVHTDMKSHWFIGFNLSNNNEQLF